MIIKRNRPLPKFKCNIGDELIRHGDILKIIDREYRDEKITRNGIQYDSKVKYYKYHCENCDNEDWIIENSLMGKMKCGCNVCCVSGKKVMRGYNDITTTAPWMVKYFIGGSDEASKYMKYNKQKMNFKCPHCGRIITSTPERIYANGNLSCPCKDGWSYPNKFIYALLEQAECEFYPEKEFEWSNRRVYDEYVITKNGVAIIEMHGEQHYNRKIHSNSRTIEEEQENDQYKLNMAISNGISNYFIIDSRKSNMEYIKNSIEQSGLLDFLSMNTNHIDWSKCSEFATSNLVKAICECKKENPSMPISIIAANYKIAYQTALRYIETGVKLGWIEGSILQDKSYYYKLHQIKTNHKPIYCETNNMYYSDAGKACEVLSTDQLKFYPRQLRQSITRNHKYRNYKFYFTTQEEFNKHKQESPERTIGDPFLL